jgi:cytosine/adenosine deaminase-related metal-dependent hydrolase
MTLLTKLDDELEEAAAKSRAARARKLQKLQRTPGVLRGVRGNFLDFEGPNGPLDPQNLQDKVTTELPLGSVEPQLDQVRFSVDYILVLDSSDKQIAFGPAAKIKATYPRLVIVDEFDDNKVILPGFIDTHTHYPQTNIIAAPGNKLEEWLNKFIIPREAEFCDVKETAEQTAEFYLRRMLKAGTTTVVSFATSRRTSVDAFFNVAKRLNLRTATGLTGWDLLSEDYPGVGGLNKGFQNTPEEFEAVTEDLYKKWHKHGRLMYALAPRWQPASSTNFLAIVGKLWKKYQPQGAFLATHLLETRNERDVSTPNLFTGTNGVAPKFPVPGAKDMYGVFQAFNLTGPRAIMGHTVWATEDEYVRMNKDGTVIGHCPASNSYLGSGDFKTPFVAAQKGIKWTICNDMGGGNYYNMLKVRFLCPPRPKKKSWMGVWRGVWEEGHARTEGGRYWCRSARLMGHRKE